MTHRPETGRDRPSATVEISRTHLPTGEPAPLTTVHEVRAKRYWKTELDPAMELIRPYQPSRTSDSCTYTFDSDIHGTGRITIGVKGGAVLGGIYRERMDEKVHMLELERALGQREPFKIPDLPIAMWSYTLKLWNPYMQIVYGFMFTIPGALAIYSVFTADSMPDFLRPIFLVLGVFVTIYGFVGLTCRGLARIRWWHRARAEVKRRGDKMPSDLGITY